jgi:hypothetical protein
MEKPAQDDNTPSEGNRPVARRAGPNGWLLIGLLIILALMFFANPSKPTSYIDDYYFFLQQVEAENVRSIALHGVETASGEFKDPPLEPEFDSDGKPKKDRQKLEKRFSVRLLQTKAAQDEPRRANRVVASEGRGNVFQAALCRERHLYFLGHCDLAVRRHVRLRICVDATHA